MDSSGINPIKQNLNIKQYIGWFITIFFPFSIKSMVNYTSMPLVVALIYWVVCGIILRLLIDKKLPYFNPKVKGIKKEIVLLIMFTIITICFYIIGCSKNLISPKELTKNIFLFVIFNGFFEQLVLVNILDLAGARIKLNGFIAVFIYVTLINALFWNKFIPVPLIYTNLVIIFQCILIFIPINMYIKTGDITIWSIQHIIYNLIIVFLCEFGPKLF